MGTWPPGDLDTIGTSEEVQISTRRQDDTLSRPTTIWIVRVGDDLYVRSGFGATNPWYRRAIARPTGRIRAGGLDRAVSFDAADPSLRSTIDAAYRAKYHRYPSNILGPMVADDAASAALRLRPADND